METLSFLMHFASLLQTYVFIVGMFLCLLCQLIFLNKALERFNALLMIPVL